MKTLNTLVLVLVTLFISLTSFSQTTHKFYVTVDLNVIIDTTVSKGDKVEFYNSSPYINLLVDIDSTQEMGDYIINDIVNGGLIFSTTFSEIGDKTITISNPIDPAFYLLKVNFTIIQSTVGTNTLSDIKFNIFPNPTTDFLNITTSDNIQSVKVFDLNGRIVLSKDFDAADVKLDVSKLEKGIYSVVVNGNSKMTFIKE